MDAQEHERKTEIVRGIGAMGQVPAIVDGRAFLVTDRGLVEAGHAARLQGALESAGVEVHRYDEVRPNPDEDDVAACHQAFGRARRGGAIEWIVALGGGSAIDVAKGCAMLACGGGRMADYVGRASIDVATPRLVAVPTTAGTGSETQSFALISNRDTGQKMACGGTAPVAAVLDPELTLTMPAAVTACTGLDTLTHAVEAFVTRRRSPSSSALALEAFQLAERAFEAVLERPEDVDERAKMLHASALAGQAIEQSMLGAAHSMANPMTRRFDVAHGQAVGQALPAVVAYNSCDPATCSLYAELARAAGVAGRDASDAAAAAALGARLRALVDRAGFATHVDGVPAAAAEELAAEAATQWTAQFNPRAVDAAAFAQLYREILA